MKHGREGRNKRQMKEEPLGLYYRPSCYFTRLDFHQDFCRHKDFWLQAVIFLHPPIWQELIIPPLPEFEGDISSFCGREEAGKSAPPQVKVLVPLEMLSRIQPTFPKLAWGPGRESIQHIHYEIKDVQKQKKNVPIARNKNTQDSPGKFSFFL